MRLLPMKSCHGCIGSSPTSSDGATEPITASATSMSTSTPTSSSSAGTGGGTSRRTSTPSSASAKGSVGRAGATSSATRGNGSWRTRRDGPAGQAGSRQGLRLGERLRHLRRARRYQARREEVALRPEETQAFRTSAEAAGRRAKHPPLRPSAEPRSRRHRQRLPPPCSRRLEDNRSPTENIRVEVSKCPLISAKRRERPDRATSGPYL